jgi:hypothetical protein
VSEACGAHPPCRFFNAEARGQQRRGVQVDLDLAGARPQSQRLVRPPLYGIVHTGVRFELRTRPSAVARVAISYCDDVAAAGVRVDTIMQT